jgi:hypothetical protein
MKYSLLFILFVFNFSFAQKYELGKVTAEELQEKRHPLDSTASAAVLFIKGKDSFEYSPFGGYHMKTEVQVKIKIYKKEGLNWASKKVKYYVGSNYVSNETISFAKAITYNLVDGKIEKTKLLKEGEFDEKISKYWNNKKIVMPNVREGSIIEYQYTIRSYYNDDPRGWEFQTMIPVNYSEYKTLIPEYYTYRTNLRGNILPRIEVDHTMKHTESKSNHLETITTYTAENLPAIIDESYVNNIHNYMSSIEFELLTVKYPNQPLESYSTDWGTISKNIYADDDFGFELDKTEYFEEDLKQILTGLNTVEEKINAIFSYVKSTISWNNYMGYSCRDGVKKAYTNKTGNVAEINLMLTSMLRHIGLTANPVLVSTRANGIPVFPNKSAFNYVIVAVEEENKLMLLDATEKFSNVNVLPFRDLNWKGRLIRKGGTSIEIDLIPNELSNDVITLSYSVNTAGLISGKVRRQMTDYNALKYRKNVVDEKEETYLEKLEQEYGNIEIADYQRNNAKDINLPVSETFSFTSSNSTELMGGKIYINPMLFYASHENPFKQEVREYPVDFGFPFMDKYAINIQIPEEYKIESMPTSSNFSTLDNIGSFKFMTSTSGNTIQVSIVSQMNTPIIASEYYAMLKEFYKTMIDKQNEKIVLVKI